MPWITPCHRRADFPSRLSLEHKIVIFQKQTFGWQLDIANSCINGDLPSMRHSGFAVLMIVFSYFEMIAKLKAGYTKQSASEHYFRCGVIDVFPHVAALPVDGRNDLLKILYRSVRCGLYHAGTAQPRLVISGDYSQALVYDEETGKARINPHKLVPHMIGHLSVYVASLGDPANTELRRNFEERFDYLNSWDPLESP